MRSLVMFFFMVVFIYLYSYVIGGETSMLMLYMLLISPLISLALTYPARRRLKIEVTSPSQQVEKDGVLKVHVSIKNHSFLPVPFLEINFLEAINLTMNGSKSQRISLGAFQKRTFTMEYWAKRRGVSLIGIESIFVKDYLGFIKYPVVNDFDLQQYKGEITVLPKLFSIKAGSTILNSSGNASTAEAFGPSTIGQSSWAGEPGYEFREYMPGDALHKIHWKLSAKKDTLMVRLDEGRGIPKKHLILDPCFLATKEIIKKKPSFFSRFEVKNAPASTVDTNMEIEEKVLESLLALAYAMVRNGRNVDVWLYENEKWAQYPMMDKKNIVELQHRLAAYGFLSPSAIREEARIPLMHIVEKASTRSANAGEAAIVTGHLDKYLSQWISQMEAYKLCVDTVYVEEKNKSKNMEEFARKGGMWRIDKGQDLHEAFS